MQEMTEAELSETLTEVCRRAAVDPSFRSLALTNPPAAISTINSKALPGGMIVKFADNSGNTLTLPLPDPVSGVSQELSEAELETVAGGVSGVGVQPITVQWQKGGISVGGGIAPKGV